MADAVVAYDRDLPEIPGRCLWERPGSYLVKDDAAPTGWREDTTGRGPSELLLTPKIRAAVDAWRAAGYAGARAPAKAITTLMSLETDLDQRSRKRELRLRT